MGVTYQEPFKAFRFLVEVESGGVAVAAFTHFSGVKMTVDTVQARSGNDNRGVQDYIPVLTRFEPVTLTKGVVGDNDFLDWLFFRGRRAGGRAEGRGAAAHTQHRGAGRQGQPRRDLVAQGRAAHRLRADADGRRAQRGAFGKPYLCHHRHGAHHARATPVGMI